VGAPAGPGSRRGNGHGGDAPPEGEHAHARNGAATGPAAPHGAGGQGCTAVAALVRGGRLVVANTGDSRAVLSVRGRAEPLSQDHKPVLLEEAARIARAGGFVRDNRVNGALAVSRTLGDLDFKRNAALPPHEQMVVATPDVRAFDLADGDEFLILACDGVWDVMSSQEAVDFVRARLRAGEAPHAAAEAVCDACLAPDLKGACRGCDNMSVVVVHFRETGRGVASALARLGARLRRALPGR
jgi:protein phosphatase 1G